jgi:glycosidase
MDMVLNHTSDQHRWFQESMRSRTDEKADWFVWNDGIPADTPGTTPFQKRFAHDGRVPPNNWESLFGGSAWEWVPARAQFYYHRFYRQQPDLNWNNPAVETAMFDAMRFWLDRGVAGFRLDAITSIFEDPGLRDEPQLGGVNDQGDPTLEHIYTDWTRRLIALRRSKPALADGAMRMLDADDAQVLIYARTAATSHQVVIVALNLSGQPQLVRLNAAQSDTAGARPIAAGRARTLLSTDPSLQGEVALASLELAPYAVWIGAVRGR